MKVFKFGGASTNSLERIQNMAGIVQEFKHEPLWIVVSAMGKTTNALEKVAEAFYANDTKTALELFAVIKNQHITTAKYLLVTEFNACIEQLNDFFTEVEWLLHDKAVKPFDYYYDQIVCIGELLSTTIIAFYLQEIGINNQWVDVRDLLRTDNNFRDAGIDWEKSEQLVSQFLTQQTNKQIFVTQGFIGATDENESTTLGREGSDYTAAIFANLLNAKDVTIWKDVEGVMNADPKQFADATIIEHLNFTEVIEMAYYGAQVIHPKTIKPLQNKGIPLLVKCFTDINIPGTIIDEKKVKNLPPIIVVKNNQVLMHLSSKDFSFVGEKPVMKLYEALSTLKLKPNLVQTGAIGVQVCLDDLPEKITNLALSLEAIFDVQIEKGLKLLSIRHYTNDIADKLLANEKIVLEQKTPVIQQVLIKI
ncbi:MAG: aspartate kinase [Chitinophagaceae bacterium]